MAAYRNPHSDYIDQRIERLRSSDKWKTLVVITEYDDFVNDFAQNVFASVIYQTFTKAYLQKHPCSDCGGEAKERCHGIGEERPLLVHRALQNLGVKQGDTVRFLDIVVAFLEAHKNTHFTFKCSACHRAEQPEFVVRQLQPSQTEPTKSMVWAGRLRERPAIPVDYRQTHIVI